MEHPYYVTFNGRVGALTDNPLLVKAGERVRLFVGTSGRTNAQLSNIPSIPIYTIRYETISLAIS
jgi:hypothetical protein